MSTTGTSRRHSRHRSLQSTSEFLSKLLRKKKVDHGSVTRRWLSSLGPTTSDYDPRIVPQAIDRIASVWPDKIWGSVPRTKDPADGFVEITWREYALAIDRAADWFENELGKETKGEVISFLAGSKLVSVILVVAAVKLGNYILFMSPRNSLEGQLSLVDKMKSKYIATPKLSLPQVEQIKDARPHLKHFVVPELDHFLSGPTPTSRPFRARFEDICSEPMWYIHSSGTTSLPKPVGWSHGVTAGMMHELLHHYPEGRTLLQETMEASPRMLVVFPLFHLAGMCYALPGAAVAGYETVFPPEDVPINSSSLNKMLISSKATFVLLTPPSLIEEVAKDPVYYKNLVRHPLIHTGGAGLSRGVGDALVKDGMTILNVIASSETGFIPLLKPQSSSEWYAFRFRDGPAVEMRHIENGRHELVLLKTAGERKIGVPYPSVFYNYPEITEYRTNDMFVRHPEPRLSHLWVNAGRADDVIVLANGEKFTPLALEEALQSEREVNSCLVFGMQREQAALLVEPRNPAVYETEESQAEFIEALWPKIAVANSKIANHGRIVRTHILLADPQKGFLRTAKGSVQRSKMYVLYAPEMDRLYASHDDAGSENTQVSNDKDEDDGSLEDLKHRICRLAGIDSRALAYDDNVFNAGFDSLHCSQLVKEIRASDGTTVQTSVIYNNPSIRKLQAALRRSSGNRGESAPAKPAAGFVASTVASTVKQLTKDLPLRSYESPGKVVLLTGTSGGLGQHLLDVARKRYSHVYCLLRRSVSPEQQEVSGVTYLHADLTSPQLGLNSSHWTTLLRTVTHVVHNAWLVDFNHPLSHFTSNILGVRSLIDFAAAAHKSPRICFASSISAVAGMSASHGGALGEKIFDLDEKVDQTEGGSLGYAQSKRASELLLARAGEISGVRSTICRIGQIAGTSTPAQIDSEGALLPSWQSRDFIPSMLRSAKYLKAVPREITGMGRLDWTPIDHMARAIFELLEAGDGPNADVTQVYHVTNPATPPEWADILSIIRRRLAEPDNDVEAIETLGLREWVDRLEKSAEGASRKEMEQNPGIKLVEFFRKAVDRSLQIPVLDTSRAVEASETLRGEPAMNEKWMDTWLQEWFREEKQAS